MPKGQEKESHKTFTGPTHESLKDGRDASSALAILDTQGLRTNPFGANITGENSYKRAERITAALHLLTNHVRNDEPLRDMIRNSGLNLLDTILDLRTGFRAIGSEKGQTALAIIRRLISLVRMLAVAGYVSAQNATTVSDALDELGALLVSSQRSMLSEQFIISRDDLVPPPGASLSVRPERPAAPAVERRSVPERAAPGVPSDVAQGEPIHMDAARSARILDILKLGGTLGIKDIASNLPQYSEKMIQRELAGLVQRGNVRKIGEKRWSRYQVI